MNAERPLGPKGAILMAIAFFAVGVAILILSFTHAAVVDNPDNAPRWVIAAAGLVFLFGGFVPLAGTFHWSVSTNRWVGLPIILALGAVINWVAFFPGPRHFSSSASFLGVAVSHASSGELTGRVLFGIVAVLIDLLVIVGTWKLIRGARRGGTVAGDGN